MAQFSDGVRSRHARKLERNNKQGKNLLVKALTKDKRNGSYIKKIDNKKGIKGTESSWELRMGLPFENSRGPIFDEELHK